MRPRGGLHEHPPGVAHEPPPGLDHEQRDDQGGHGVGTGPAGEVDDQTGDRGRDEREQVVEDVLVGALDVEPRPVGPAQQPGGDQVDHDAREAGEDDEEPLDLGREDEAAHSFVHEEGRQEQQRDAVELRRDDLSALQAVGEAAARRPGGDPHGHEREEDGERVGQHVTGVGDQRQRPGDETDDHLDGHEGDDERQRRAQIAPVGVLQRRRGHARAHGHSLVFPPRRRVSCG